jgi:uncharacterized protein (TIGR03118 family)
MPEDRGADRHRLQPEFGLHRPRHQIARILYLCTEDGTISAWNGGATAIIAVDNARTPNARLGAVYKGLALGVNKAGTFLFATNFRAGTVEVYDSTFKRATTSGGFKDKGTPAIPANYAPFGIQSIDGSLIVTYALQNSAKHDDVAGPATALSTPSKPKATS